MSNLMSVGNYYVVGIFIWCFFLGYILFPDFIVFRFLIRLSQKILLGKGARMKW